MIRITTNSRWMVLVVASLVFSGCNKGNKTAQGFPNAKKVPPIPVTAIVVKDTESDTKIQIMGSVLPNEKVELRSEINGRITHIYFKEGQKVRKGELLVKIFDQDLTPQLQKIRLQQDLATRELTRKKKLLEINGISQEEFDIAENQISTLNADANLIEASLRKTSIVAPFNGVVGLRYVSEGEFVSSTTLIATLQQIDPIKIEFDVPEKYGALIHTGSVINFTTISTDIQFTGKVYAIEPMVDLNTRTFKVRAHSANEKSLLKPGAFVKIELILEKDKNAVVIPTEAIISSMKGQQVYLYSNGIALSKIVSTGIRNEATIQIREGLKISDTVITSGIMQLKDSTKVQIKIKN